jgi:hypothetical protein
MGEALRLPALSLEESVSLRETASSEMAGWPGHHQVNVDRGAEEPNAGKISWYLNYFVRFVGL